MLCNLCAEGTNFQRFGQSFSMASERGGRRPGAFTASVADARFHSFGGERGAMLGPSVIGTVYARLVV
jgi:hypothetical protein